MRTITPQPGHTEAEVIAALESGQFVYADCYTIEPLQGDKIRYTNYQQPVSVVPVGEVMGVTYRSNGLIIAGLRVKMATGIEVDEQQLQIDYASTTLYQNDLPWPQALLQGRLDGATIRRDRYISAGPGQPWLGGFPWFAGLVSNLSTVGRQSASMNVKSNLVLLNIQMPRDLWEANCKNTWGDPACGVTQSLWAVTATVGSSPTRTFLPWTGGDATYALGKVNIDNGDSTTRVRTISRADGTGLYLSYPLDFDPVAGMTFTAYPGCSRTDDATYGCPKYHGVDWPKRFKGFPFVPVAETAVGG